VPLPGDTYYLARCEEQVKKVRRESQESLEAAHLEPWIMLAPVMPPVDKARPMIWEMIRGKFLEEAIPLNVR